MPAKGRRPAVEEDLAFQQNDWRAQRIGWAVLLLIIAAALAGLLGPGPLSSSTAGDADRLQVQYERFVRHGGQTDLTIRIASAQPGPLRIAIRQKYLQAFQLQGILPAPLRAQVAGEMLVYTFDGPDAAEPVEIKYVLQPNQLGFHEARISTGTSGAIAIRQFAFP